MNYSTSELTVSTHPNMCLAPYTRVLVSNKGYVPACDVTVGTLLAAPHEYDPSATTKVINVRRFVATNLICIDECVEVTEGHPFLTSLGSWVPAAELKVGDWLMGSNGPRLIESIRRVNQRESTEVIDIVAEQPFLIEGFVTMTKSMLHKQAGVGLTGYRGLPAQAAGNRQYISAS